MNRTHFSVFLITFLFISCDEVEKSSDNNIDEVNRLIEDIHLLKKES